LYIAPGCNSGGIPIESGRQKTFAMYPDSDRAPRQVARELVERARRERDAAGWSIEIVNPRPASRNSGWGSEIKRSIKKNSVEIGAVDFSALETQAIRSLS